VARPLTQRHRGDALHQRSIETLADPLGERRGFLDRRSRPDALSRELKHVGEKQLPEGQRMPVACPCQGIDRRAEASRLAGRIGVANGGGPGVHGRAERREVGQAGDLAERHANLGVLPGGVGIVEDGCCPPGEQSRVGLRERRRDPLRREERALHVQLAGVLVAIERVGHPKRRLQGDAEVLRGGAERHLVGLAFRGHGELQVLEDARQRFAGEESGVGRATCPATRLSGRPSRWASASAWSASERLSPRSPRVVYSVHNDHHNESRSARGGSDMILQLFRKTQEHAFKRTYAAPVADVWRAWTEPELLRQWWGPEKTTIEECEVDLRVGGRIRVVMEAGEEMGKYAGTRWPMEGTFTRVEQPHRLTYEATSWTEGEEGATGRLWDEVGLRQPTRQTRRAAVIAPQGGMSHAGLRRRRRVPRGL
jgi:uncharacterized protein YndB with AHSA1/START domain